MLLGVDSLYGMCNVLDRRSIVGVDKTWPHGGGTVARREAGMREIWYSLRP
jgi:hypothetical protein